MSGDALRREFDADKGRCYYCGGLQYFLLRAWFEHVTEEHPDTVRAKTLLDAIRKL